MINAWHLTIVSITFSCIGTASALARLYTRGILLKALKYDDLLLTLALLSGIGGVVVVIVMSFKDFEVKREGNNDQVLSNPLNWEFEIFNHVAIATYTIQNMFSRLSLIFSLRNFTPKDSRRWQHHVVNVVAVVAFLTGIIFFLVILFPCWPLRAMTYPDNWRIDGKYHCLVPRRIFWWSGLAGIVLDGVIYLLPFWLLQTINITTQQRYCLYGLFAFAGVVFVISLVRIPCLTVLRKDVLYAVDRPELMLMWLLTVVEANMLLCAASVPTLRPLWRKLKGPNQFSPPQTPLPAAKQLPEEV